MSMLRTLVLSLGLLAALPSLAGNGPAAVRKQAESSLRVTGSIVIGTDGVVQSHELDPKAPLSQTLTDFIAGAVRQWRFEPVEVDGAAVRARVPMSLRLVAKPSVGGNYSISIAGAHFGSEKPMAETDLLQRKAALKPPKYPVGALMAGGNGIVYLVAQVGPDGKVMNVAAEQVNLRVVGSENQMAELRKQFTDAAVRVAKTWTFIPPTTGEDAGDGSWLVRIPVDFRISGTKKWKPGEWETYIPGPRNMDMPWARERLKTAGSPDALPDSGMFPLGQGAKLLTPIAAS